MEAFLILLGAGVVLILAVNIIEQQNKIGRW